MYMYVLQPHVVAVQTVLLTAVALFGTTSLPEGYVAVLITALLTFWFGLLTVLRPLAFRVQYLLGVFSSACLIFSSLATISFFFPLAVEYDTYQTVTSILVLAINGMFLCGAMWVFLLTAWTQLFPHTRAAARSVHSKIKKTSAHDLLQRFGSKLSLSEWFGTTRSFGTTRPRAAEPAEREDLEVSVTSIESFAVRSGSGVSG
jgi:hypothetical protein